MNLLSFFGAFASLYVPFFIPPGVPSFLGAQQLCPQLPRGASQAPRSGLRNPAPSLPPASMCSFLCLLLEHIIFNMQKNCIIFLMVSKKFEKNGM